MGTRKVIAPAAQGGAAGLNFILRLKTGSGLREYCNELPWPWDAKGNGRRILIPKVCTKPTVRT